MAPPTISISDEAGMYLLEGFDPNTSVTINVSRSPAFRNTRNAEISIGDQSLVKIVLASAETDVLRQFASVGGSEQDNRGIVFAEIREPDQSPLEGIPLADVSLTNGAMVPIGDGPYFFGSTGDIDPGLTVSTAFNGRGARLAFLNVPDGEVTLTIALPLPHSDLSKTFSVEQDVVHLLILH